MTRVLMVEELKDLEGFEDHKFWGNNSPKLEDPEDPEFWGDKTPAQEENNTPKDLPEENHPSSHKLKINVFFCTHICVKLAYC